MITTTIPRQVRDLLIFLASSSYCPDTWVLDIFSDPARSTKYSLLCLFESVFRFLTLTLTWNKLWDLEDRSFILVAAMVLFVEPVCMTAFIS
jgi:hypothetical protein